MASTEIEVPSEATQTLNQTAKSERLMNNSQTMLCQLSSDANRAHPSNKHRTGCLQIYAHLVSEYCQTTRTRDVGLSNIMARPMKLR